jgi:hypothetical protein
MGGAFAFDWKFSISGVDPKSERDKGAVIPDPAALLLSERLGATSRSNTSVVTMGMAEFSSSVAIDSPTRLVCLKTSKMISPVMAITPRLNRRK